MATATHLRHGTIFGIPMDKFGLFSSILMSLSLGFSAFFATCFVAIMSILFYNAAGHHVNYADSYKYVALPVGLAVLAVSLIVFIGMWLRRKLSGN